MPLTTAMIHHRRKSSMPVLRVQGAITCWTSCELVWAAEHTSSQTLSELSTAKAGSVRFGRLVSLAVALMLVGVMCVFVKFMSSTLGHMLVHAATPWVLPATCVLLLIISSVVKDARVLAQAGAVGPFLSMVVALYVIGKSVVLLAQGNHHAGGGASAPAAGSEIALWVGPNVLAVPGVMMFNFLAHSVVIELASLLHAPSGPERSNADAKRPHDSTISIVVAYSLQVLVLAVIGIVGLVANGPSVSSSVLRDFSPDGGKLTLAVNVALLLQCLVSALSLMGCAAGLSISVARRHSPP